MKLLHTSDLHIGKSLLDYDLLEDQRYIFDRIIDIAKEQEVDALLIAGDVYDKAVPSEGAVRLLDNFLKKLKDEHIKTFIISGNHDSDDRLNFASKFLSDSDIYIAAKYNGELDKYVLNDEYGDLNIYMLPYIKASTVKHFHKDADIENYEDAVRCVFDKDGVDSSVRNVILSHQFVAGKSHPTLSGSESPSVTHVGNVEVIGYDVFDAFDYVALGHIHSLQRVGRDEVRYSGSPLKYSLSEVNDDKSVTLITLKDKGDVDLEYIPLKPLREMRHIKGELKNLIANVDEDTVDDYIYITLTDEDVIDDAMGVIRNYYNRPVKLDYDNSRSKDISFEDVELKTESKPITDILGEFYNKMYGVDISEDEMKIFKEVAMKAGVINEAD